MTVFQKAAHYALSVKYEDLSPEVIEISKRSLLDYIAVTLAGAQHNTSKTIYSFIDEMGTAPQATIIGTKKKASINMAALANSAAGHVLDLDDNLNCIGHSSVMIMPALFSAGELVGASGKDIILAHVVATQVQQRIGKSMDHEDWLRGWHVTCIAGIFGTAVAAGLLLGLNEEQLANALGICTSSAAGTKANFGTQTKPYQVGLSACNGVNAAILAKKGMNANPEAMEAFDGYFKVINAMPYDPAREPRYDGEWVLLNPGLMYKLHSCCSGIHAGMDTVLELMQEYSLGYDDIKEIIVGCQEELPRMMHYTEAHDPEEAHFCAEYSIAACVTFGHGGYKAYTEEAIADPRVQDLSKRVKVWIDPEVVKVDQHPAKITINTYDGRVITRFNDVCKGTIKKPFTDEDFIGKYRECAEECLDEATIDALQDSILNLENISDINEVTARMVSTRCE